MERILNLSAAIITIANFIWAIAGLSLTKSGSVTIPDIPIGFLPFQIIIFLIVEFTLSYAFAILIGLTFKLFDREGLNLFPASIVILLSAWTSIFNLQWLLIGPFESGLGYLFKYSLGIVFVNAVGATMVGMRERKQYFDIDYFFSYSFMHGIPFLVMAIVVPISQ